MMAKIKITLMKKIMEMERIMAKTIRKKKIQRKIKKKTRIKIIIIRRIRIRMKMRMRMKIKIMVMEEIMEKIL